MTIMTTARICSGCNQSINDLYFLDVGSKFYWHLTCLKCNDCSCLLELQPKCYLSDGKFYCADDYAKLKRQSSSLAETLSILNNEENSASKNSCRNCKLGISSNEYVIRLKLNSKGEVLFHLNCFFCTDCNQLISPGQQHGILDEKIYCSQHYFAQLNQQHQLYQNSIFNNHGLNYMPIKDETAHKIDTQMFQYSNNHHQPQQILNLLPIQDQNNIPQHRLIEDYDHKLNRVGQDENNNLNKLAGYCSSQDIIDHNNNNNEKHLEEQANSARSFSLDSKEPNGFYLPVSSSDSYLAKNKSKSNGPISSNGRKTNMLMNSSGGTSNSSAHSKKKRMRTSFKHQQLRIMKAHFQINQNPDSKELKELSEKTGLPKRVLQVWFQNSRAKQRKTTPTHSLTPSTLLIKNRNSNIAFSEGEMKSTYRTGEEENDEGLEMDDENFELDEMSSDDIDDKDENEMESGDDNDDDDDENDSEKNENLDFNFKRRQNNDKLAFIESAKVKRSSSKKPNASSSVLSEQIVQDNYFKPYQQNQLHPDQNLIQGLQHHHHHQNTIVDFYHCY